MLQTIVFMPFILAVFSFAFGRKRESVRDLFVLACVALELILTLYLWKKPLTADLPGILGGMGIHFAADGFRWVYALVTAFMWLCTALFSRQYFAHEPEGLDHYYVFVLMTLGATEGVMLSADFMTAFAFFEILSFTSFTWVIHEETADAIRAGYTYLFIAVIGGLVLLMGLLLLYDCTGTLVFCELPDAIAASGAGGKILPAAVCILFGFGCKAGMFPVHVWLPKAHPVAPSPASALLSGVLTKVGIYGILMTAVYVCAGNRSFGLIVLGLGVITMALGAVLALFSVNLKRTLACSSMSQIGFILTGTAMLLLNQAAGEEEGVLLAASGTVLHMVNHSLIKLTLFMAAGVVVMNRGTLILDDIRGWGRRKHFLKIAFALGALGISGVPVFNGYISKTLLHEAIVEGIAHCEGLGAWLHLTEWIFLISGGITFAYMLKLFICIFVQKHPEKQAEFDAEGSSMNLLSSVVILGSSLFMIIMGRPGAATRVAYLVTGNEEILHFHAFSWANLRGGLTSLIIGMLVYLLVVRTALFTGDSYVNRWPARLDLENLVYRPLLTELLPDFFGDLMSVPGENRILRPFARGVMFGLTFTGRILASSLDWLIVALRRTVMRETWALTRERVRRRGLRAYRREIRKAAAPIYASFSFALMMTCIGIMLILGVLLFYMVR